MRKLIIIQYGILACILLLVGACKKDTPEKPDIQKYGDQDVRILKVGYKENRETIYHYNELGKLKYIVTDKNDLERIEIVFGDDEITFDTKRLDGWQKSDIKYINDRIDYVTVWTKFPIDNIPSVEGIVNFNISDDKLQSININDSMLSKVAEYQPLKSRISSYNSYHLPEESKSIYIKSWVNPIDVAFEFTFEYVEAKDIPAKLKRLVNEELLHINKYGVTNMDINTIYFEGENHSYYGEGNWLVSFGLPQYYILEEKSSHIVSKTTTRIYKVNEAGEKEYERTITKEFPYIHNEEAKTLEIAGLKIWYEFVE